MTIRAYDNRGAYGSFDVTVTVTAANEPPVITGSDARNFQENGTGTIYTYRATDPEGDDFTWIAHLAGRTGISLISATGASSPSRTRPTMIFGPAQAPMETITW